MIKIAGLTESNHYNTLNVSPNATGDEIKKAFRKLALMYHPDVAIDPVAEEKFRTLKAAYDVLSNSKSRQHYHYKIFYTHIKTNQVATSNSIASQTAELLQFTKALDPYRLDEDGLYIQIMLLINLNNQSILKQCEDKNLMESIALNLLSCSQLLTFYKASSIYAILLSLVNDNESLINIINKQIHWQKMLHYWHQYKFLLAIVISITLCVIFFNLV